MARWLGKLFGMRTAVQTGRQNPLLIATVEKSSHIYHRIPLREFIDEAKRQQLSRQLYLDINEICNSTDPVTSCREKLAATMLDFARYQVLVIPPIPEDDASGLRGQPGISGELGEHIFSLAEKNESLSAELRDFAEPRTPDTVWNFVQQSYWMTYWFLETINAARIELGDRDEEDWYRSFMHAACANREHIYRRDLALPSCFEPHVADIAPTAYSIFTDIVLSGAGNPGREWREYYRDSEIPYPQFEI
ncbi:MAG: hypothetical protein GXP15_13540 [Gammaproteobacteria bacterium]|nr:hypothetical protein [Gammaproteobacteria bacterium]